MKLYYDFHIHSCLSPCGDDDCTPNNIVNMALIKGLHAIAVADHNTGRNVPAVMAAGKRNGLIVLPAMELTTSEDIHILCLFEKYEQLEKLEKRLESTRLKIRNKREIFGKQQIMDENDEPIGEAEDLLIVSSGVSVEEAAKLVEELGGIPVPAHVDKQANGLIGVLGAFDFSLGFRLVESKADPRLGLPYITNSDAHYLWDISEAEHFLEAETCSVHGVFQALKRMCADGGAKEE